MGDVYFVYIKELTKDYQCFRAVVAYSVFLQSLLLLHLAHYYLGGDGAALHGACGGLILMRVSQAKVDALLEDMYKHIPGLQIIYKDEAMPTWWLQVLAWFIAVIGVFNPEFKQSWESTISNGIGSKWVLLPSRATHGDFTKYNVYATLRHEYVHLRDQQAGPIWFYLTYLLFPLPIWYTGRAHWECRGYAQNMIVEFEEFGEISQELKDWVKAQFTGTLYLWMWRDKGYVDSRVEEIAQGVSRGVYQGYFPRDMSWL